MPGAVRASLGLGTTPADLDRLTDALSDIARNGPATRYRYVSADDEYQPVDTWRDPVPSRGRRWIAEPAWA